MLPDSIRLGKEYRETRRHLEEITSWPREQIFEWQIKKYKSIANDAYENTRFYKEIFNDIGMHPNDIKSYNDIKFIPLLNKETIQLHKDKFISKLFKPRSLAYGTTSGTSGIPLGLYSLKYSTPRVETAFVHNVWSAFDYQSNLQHVILRGNVLKDGPIQKWGRHLLLSSFNLDESNMKNYVAAINSLRPDYFQAYPSAISTFCDFLQRNKLKLPDSLKLIMCSSENLFSFQREKIKNTLKLPTCNLYGNSERTVIGGNCRHSEAIHINPAYGFLELIDYRGEICRQEGQVGEIVTTAFTSPAFPLLRYRTGDFAVYNSGRCACGWNSSILKNIDGREQEFFLTSDGRKISIAAINMHTDIFDDFKQFQFRQSHPGYVDFLYIPHTETKAPDVKRITKELSLRFGDAMNINYEEVDDIPLSKSGKHSFLIQNCTP